MVTQDRGSLWLCACGFTATPAAEIWEEVLSLHPQPAHGSAVGRAWHWEKGRGHPCGCSSGESQALGAEGGREGKTNLLSSRNSAAMQEYGARPWGT